eukprot:364145-Chlamydomonas_euryale.AAC.2
MDGSVQIAMLMASHVQVVCVACDAHLLVHTYPTHTPHHKGHATWPVTHASRFLPAHAVRAHNNEGSMLIAILMAWAYADSLFCSRCASPG